MTVSQLAIGLLCVIAISGGQILFKLASAVGGEAAHERLNLYMYFNWYLLISLVIYALATVFWVWLLSQVPLKKAYPLMSIAFFLVPLMSRVFLMEALEARVLVGALCICFGVFISVR